MKLTRLGGALALALLFCAPVAAQNAAGRAAPSGTAPEQAPVFFAAKSAALTAIDGTVTSSAVTPTTGAATFASGTASIGPMTPELGRPVRIILKGTWAGTVQVGTSSAANACAAGTINPLTVAGQAYGNFTSNANELIDEAWLSGVVYCLTATVTSGTLTYAVRQ